MTSKEQPRDIGGDMPEDWIVEATSMFHHYRKESEKYRDVKELCIVYAGKATGLHELLEKFGVAPEMPRKGE